VTFGPFAYDARRRILRRGASEIPLPPRVLGVLDLLLSRAGDVVPRQQLIDTVWKEAFVTDTSLAEAVSFLRQALGDDSQAPTYIQTVHRRGYRFVAPVEERPEPRTEPFPVAEPPTVQPAASEVVRPTIANELLPWSIAILSFIAALSAIWYATNQTPVSLPILNVPIDLGPGEEFDARAPALAISPGGSMLAWSACRNGLCRLYVRELQNLGGSQPLQGTEGAAAPFFSPDELWIGFFADGKVKKVFVRGGGAATIAEASQPFGAAWLADGTIVFASSAYAGLMRVNQNGGPVESLTQPSAQHGELSHAYPSASPDGAGVIFLIRTSPVPQVPGRLALLPRVRRGAPWRVLVDGANIGGAVGTEFIAFIRDTNLMAVGYDWVRQTAGGVPQVVRGHAVAPQLALSPSGAMASAGVTRRELSTPYPPMWSWNVADVVPPANLPPLYHPALSLNGRGLAGIDTESLTDVWSVDVEKGTRARLSNTPLNAYPVWSADSSRIYYASRRQEGFEIWSRRPDGTGDQQRVLARSGRHLFPSSASASGDVAFVESGGASRADVGILPAGASEPRLVAQTAFDEIAPALSSDGRLLAYQSDESGRWEITLVRLADGARNVISRDGGVRPFWSADGRLLYFESNGQLMNVRVEPSAGTASAPIAVSRLTGTVAVGITPSGEALLSRSTDPSTRLDAGGLTVNWIEHLRRTLLPPLPKTPR
jgi:DNA-binding winged helix-turn-helix (wHTH) protein